MAIGKTQWSGGLLVWPMAIVLCNWHLRLGKDRFWHIIKNFLHHLLDLIMLYAQTLKKINYSNDTLGLTILQDKCQFFLKSLNLIFIVPQLS